METDHIFETRQPSNSAYAGGCRCQPCRDAHAKWAREYFAAKINGTWTDKRKKPRCTCDVPCPVHGAETTPDEPVVATEPLADTGMGKDTLDSAEAVTEPPAEPTDLASAIAALKARTTAPTEMDEAAVQRAYQERVAARQRQAAAKPWWR